uniref:PGG domain-containing protein n=1 Tax=Quercus lobata TaxID=97700 RepID=A0A7N2LU06_QUELO
MCYKSKREESVNSELAHGRVNKLLLEIFTVKQFVSLVFLVPESQEFVSELAKLSVKDGSSNVNLSKSKLPKYGSCSGVLSTDETGGSSRQPLKQGGVTPLFLATKSGCVEIVKEILKIYPQAVEHIDDEGQCILHVAIKYRQLEVFEHVSKMEVPMRWLVRRLDNNGNTILHMVGMPIHDYVPEKMLGPALQLQEELLWFERVKSVTKEAFVCHQNNMKETAEALFATTKSKLRNSARDWLIRTSEGSSIVAVLIATVAFTAAYTIPGGPDQKTGFPVLLYHPFFVVSTASDVLSLACALTSVVMFLSILTAPFRLEDFKHSLPNKLMLGFTFLFFSVVMMMISFSATIILMVHGSERWTKILFYSLSFLPVGIFALAYFPLYLSVTKTHKHLLKKIKEAFPCRCWFPTVSRDTYFFHSNRAEICLQGGSNNNSSRDNPEGELFGFQDTSQTKLFSV